MYVCIHMYIYNVCIYIYTYIYTHIFLSAELPSTVLPGGQASILQELAAITHTLIHMFLYDVKVHIHTEMCFFQCTSQQSEYTPKMGITRTHTTHMYVFL